MTQTSTANHPHYRLTLEELKEQFQAGLIKAKNYLYYLIKSVRRDGWHFRIPNVRAFCEEHGLSKSSFYRAKAQLVAAGLIKERIIGAVDLWIPSPGESEESDGFFSEALEKCPTSGNGVPLVGIESQQWDSVSHKWECDRDQPQAGQPLQIATDLLQIKDQLSLSLKTETELTGKEERKIPQPELIEPEFRQWLIEKAHQLPQFPTFPDRWIASQAKRKDIKAQYLKEVKGIQTEGTTANVPPPPPPPDFQQIEEAITQAHIMGDRQWVKDKLDHLFGLGYTEEVSELCQLNKPWGFKVSSLGVVDRADQHTTRPD